MTKGIDFKTVAEVVKGLGLKDVAAPTTNRGAEMEARKSIAHKPNSLIALEEINGKINGLGALAEMLPELLNKIKAGPVDPKSPEGRLARILNSIAKTV